MKRLIAFCLIMSLAIDFAFANDAESAGLKILGAQYNGRTDSIEVAVKYKGGCNDRHGLKIDKCDSLSPRTCRVDVLLKVGAVCKEDVEGIISLTRKQLQVDKPEFKKATLIIQNQAKESRVEVTLP